MAKAKKPKAGDNQANDEKKSYIERMAEIERAFNDAKAEYKESKKDLGDEINARKEDLGFDAGDVKRWTKVYMDFDATVDENTQTTADIAAVEMYVHPNSDNDEV